MTRFRWRAQRAEPEPPAKPEPPADPLPSTKRLTPALWKATCRRIGGHIEDPHDPTRCMYCGNIIDPKGHDK